MRTYTGRAKLAEGGTMLPAVFGLQAVHNDFTERLIGGEVARPIRARSANWYSPLGLAGV